MSTGSNRKSSKGRPRTTHSWLVYPPNYKPGDGYHEYRHIKRARGKAMALGIGSDMVRVIRQFWRDGSESSQCEDAFFYRRNPRYGRPVVNESA